MLDVEVIDDAAAAVVALDPVRARLLAELVTPASAPDGRPHRLVVAAHPLPHRPADKEES